MKILSTYIVLLLPFFTHAQTGIIGELKMNDKQDRAITIYDIREFGIRIDLINELGVPYVDLIDMPIALLDSAKIGRIQAYDMGLYYTSPGYGYKVKSNLLSPAKIDEMIHTRGGHFVPEPGEPYLIGIETEGEKGKYFHLFLQERENYYDLIEKETQFSDYVVSFRFEDIQLFYFR